MSIKTGKNLDVELSFGNKLLSEYNPSFSLDRYVAYFSLKNIIMEIEELQQQHRRIKKKHDDYVASETIKLQFPDCEFPAEPHTTPTKKSPLEASRSVHYCASIDYLSKSSLHVVPPDYYQLKAVEDNIAKICEVFFLQVRNSFNAVKKFLGEKESQAMKLVNIIYNSREADLRRLHPHVIPSIYRRVVNIASFRKLNLYAFQKIFLKFFFKCAANSLKLQEQLRAADTIVANSVVSKPFFDVDSNLRDITLIYATLQRTTYENACSILELYMKRDPNQQPCIAPIDRSYYYFKSFAHRQEQGTFSLKLLPCLSSSNICKKIGQMIHCNSIKSESFAFSNKEICVRVGEAVRGDDIFIIQSFVSTRNQSMSRSIIELLMSVQTVSLASAARITAVVPFMSYGSDPLAVASIAEMLQINGCKQVLTVDLETYQMEGMFGNTPVYGLSAMMEFVHFLALQLQDEDRDVSNLVVVSPTGSTVDRARKFADKLTQHINTKLFGVDKFAKSSTNTQDVIDRGGLPSPGTLLLEAKSSKLDSKYPDYNDSKSDEKDLTINDLLSGAFERGAARSENLSGEVPNSLLLPPSQVPPVMGSFKKKDTTKNLGNTSSVFIPVATAVKKPSKDNSEIDVIGDVANKNCIIVDTVIGECINALEVAKILKAKNAANVVVVATHGIFCGDAAKRIADPAIDMVIVADTVDNQEILRNSEVAKKLRIVTVAPLLGQAIRQIHSGNSLSTLLD
eukprot:Tbor_TRINITY_DN4516_c0_g1::TRINITY_DN4516_c0_g1_i1::g.15794::m.15794